MHQLHTRVLITGVGIKPVNHIFYDITTGKPVHTPVVVDGKEYKANVGAATAFECAKAGATVHMVARTAENLEKVKQWIEKSIPGAKIEYSAMDLSNKEATKKLAKTLPDDLPLYWIHSVGLGAGTVKIKDDNPYLPVDDLSDELVEAELSVLKDTVTLVRTLLPRFRKQKETRVCIVSSMSAVRSYPYGSIHCSAKGAISRFTNTIAIELHRDNIFVTDIRPGAIDTGMYDSPVIQDTIRRVGVSFGYDYTDNGGYYSPPSSVGKAIVTVLSSEGHITSLNMVARGQTPQEGS